MKMLRITLEGRTYDVGVEVLSDTHSPAPTPFASPPAMPQTAPATQTAPPAAPVVSGGGRIVSSPMAGLIFKCLVKPGDVVALNQMVIVLDAMKMETPVYAPVAGTVRAVLVKVGDAVDEGHGLLRIDGEPS